MSKVKTAISISETLFREIENLAKEMKVSRSQLFSQAVEELVNKKHNQKLLEQLNAIYEDPQKSSEEKWLTEAKGHYCRTVEEEW